jgi:serine kinase of HPr protein (carbohydrate metabolism regulator)
MKLSRIIEEIGLKVITGSDSLDREIEQGYASDLMSDVIANAASGDIWVTMQVHMNVIAIASMKEIGAVVLTHGRQPLPETLKKAEEEDVVILGSELSAFEVVGRLYRLGITGR